MPLGEFCSEEPTVSRKNLKIAWAADHHNYPDTMPEGVSQMYVADIDYSSGEPKIANKKMVLDNRNTDFKANFETQNFIAPDETMLTFSAYGYQGSEVMGLNTETGEVTNFSSADVQYDEPEGIFPRRQAHARRVRQTHRPGLPGSEAYRTLEADARWQRRVSAPHLLQRRRHLQGIESGRERRRAIHCVFKSPERP